MPPACGLGVQARRSGFLIGETVGARLARSGTLQPSRSHARLRWGCDGRRQSCTYRLPFPALSAEHSTARFVTSGARSGRAFRL